MIVFNYIIFLLVRPSLRASPLLPDGFAQRIRGMGLASSAKDKLSRPHRGPTGLFSARSCCFAALLQRSESLSPITGKSVSSAGTAYNHAIDKPGGDHHQPHQTNRCLSSSSPGHKWSMPRGWKISFCQQKGHQIGKKYLLLLDNYVTSPRKLLNLRTPHTLA